MLEFAAQMSDGHLRRDFRGAVTVHHLTDHCQQWDFPHDHFTPGTGNADVQFARMIFDLNLLRIVTKLAQPVQVILAEERQPGKIVELSVC
ncbi:hypothetical protein D3C78_1674540 [compost metagenome]